MELYQHILVWVKIGQT